MIAMSVATLPSMSKDWDLDDERENCFFIPSFDVPVEFDADEGRSGGDAFESDMMMAVIVTVFVVIFVSSIFSFVVFVCDSSGGDDIFMNGFVLFCEENVVLFF